MLGLDNSKQVLSHLTLGTYTFVWTLDQKKAIKTVPGILDVASFLLEGLLKAIGSTLQKFSLMHRPH